MTKYKVRWDTIKLTTSVFVLMVAMLLILYFFADKGFLAWFFIAALLLFLPLPYSGLVLGIAMDDKKLIVRRPFTWTTIRYEDVALCAVHSLEDGKHLIYAFVKRRGLKGYSVKGIKPRLSFEEVVKKVSKEDNIDLDINFNMARKIPVSFVENGEELKDRFLLEVGKHHARIMDEK